MKLVRFDCRFKVTLQTDWQKASWAILCGTVLGISVLLAGSAHAATGPTGLEPCLNYFTVGVSGCVPAKPASPTTVAKPVTGTAPVMAVITPTVAAPAAPTLDSKIDDFLENHGKPPREFVAFYLEPNAENAMKWISKYNEIVDRNVQLTIAWEQAEVLYKKALASGVSPSALVSSTLPPVPNLGVAIPGFTDNPHLANTTFPGFGGSMYIAPPAPIPSVDPKTGALGAMPLATVSALASDGRLGASVPILPPVAVPTSTIPSATGLPLTEDLTYYYSDVCPYCKRFNPQLSKALEGTKLTVACVDLSPKDPGPNTVPEGIACKWRMPDVGELKAQSVRQTPTLLLRGPSGYPLRISGYVDENRLQSYLNAAGLLTAPTLAPPTASPVVQ